MRRFYTYAITIFFAFVLMGESNILRAEENFFAELVPVESRGGAELAQAAKLGFSQLLVRVSGNESILEQTAFQEAVNNAQEHVVLYSYSEESDGTYLFLEYDDAFVRGLFRDESVPYWEQRRPPVVVWLALDEPYSRRFAARSDDVTLLSPSINRFEARGVEARFPLLDLTDAAAVPVNAVWTRDFDQIRRGSRRYGSDHSLVGRWIDLSDGTKLVDWYYVGPDFEQHHQMRQADVEAIWDVGVDLAVDAMRDSLAVTLQRFEAAKAISITVTGVQSIADYRAVSSVFEALSQLVELRIDAIRGDILMYRVNGVSSAQEVARLLPRRSGLRIQSASDPAQLDLIWESIQ